MKTNESLFPMSATSDGQLIFFSDTVNPETERLKIYASDANLHQSIKLPTDIFIPRHAVETSVGNLIVIHMPRVIHYVEKDSEENSEVGEDEDVEDGDEKGEDKEQEVEGEEDTVEDKDENKEMEDNGASLRMSAEDEEASKWTNEERQSAQPLVSDGIKSTEETEVQEEENGEDEFMEAKDNKEEENGKSERKSIKEDDEKEKVWKLKSTGRNRDSQWFISELNTEGQMAVHHFIPSNESQEIGRAEYLCLDSDDRVFVADMDKERVILLDSDLKWNRIICPTQEEERGEDKADEIKLLKPDKLCYDKEKNQLIVAGTWQRGVNVYTLSLL